MAYMRAISFLDRSNYTRRQGLDDLPGRWSGRSPGPAREALDLPRRTRPRDRRWRAL